MSAIVTPRLVEFIMQDLNNRIDHARVNVGGKWVHHPIHSTNQSGCHLRKYVYIQESEAVEPPMLGASLWDKEGNELVNQPLNVTKDEQGFLLIFEFCVEVKVNV